MYYMYTCVYIDMYICTAYVYMCILHVYILHACVYIKEWNSGQKIGLDNSYEEKDSQKQEQVTSLNLSIYLFIYGCIRSSLLFTGFL